MVLGSTALRAAFKNQIESFGANADGVVQPQIALTVKIGWQNVTDIWIKK